MARRCLGRMHARERGSAPRRELRGRSCSRLRRRAGASATRDRRGALAVRFDEVNRDRLGRLHVWLAPLVAEREQLLDEPGERLRRKLASRSEGNEEGSVASSEWSV